MRYSITVRATKTVVAAIAGIDDAAWVDIAYPDGGKAQVAETTLAGRRLIVRRTRLVGEQAQLWPDWRHHTFVTDRAGTPSTLTPTTAATPCANWRSATSSTAPGWSTARRVFTANAAWVVLATVAHNVWRWTTRLGGLATGPVVAKTLTR